MRIYIGGGEEGRREGMEKGGRRGGGEKGGNGEGSEERGEEEERREEAGGNHIKHKLVEKNLDKKHNSREKTLKSKVYRQTDRRQLIPSELKSLDKVRMRIYI